MKYSSSAASRYTCGRTAISAMVMDGRPNRLYEDG